MADEKKAQTVKVKGNRTVKPVYAIISVQDNAGKTLDIKKENVTIHSVEKNADAVLNALDAGKLPPGCFYKRIALG